MALLKSKVAIKEGRPHMKVNLKTTNEAENAAETPICHQRGQRTVNGIIGNTRRGIVIDKTLDPDSNNPVANKPVSTALAALAGQLEKGQVVFLDQLPESGEPHKIYVLTATNQRYWWDGSAFVKIVPTDIKDSATIKHTLTENKISLDLDETIKGKIDAALQKPAGLTKTKLVGVGASGQENIEIGDNLTLANGKLAAAGGSVSPTLNLLDFKTGEIRTSITEEEYNNLKNGLYNSVDYFTESEYEAYLPSKLFSIYNDEDKSLFCSFSSVKITGTPETGISSTNIIYQLNIGQKDTSGNYPITIEKETEIPFGSGSGSDSTLNLVNMDDRTIRTSITETEKENIKKGTYNSVFYYDPTIGNERAALTAFYPKQIVYYAGSLDFSGYQFSSDRSSITGAIVYSLNIGEKNADGTYPITIDRFSSAPFAAIKITFED